MAIVLISDTSPRADIEQGIGRLRAKLAATSDRRWREDIEHEIDDLLELWAAAGDGA